MRIKDSAVCLLPAKETTGFKSNIKGWKIFPATMKGAYNNNNIAEVDKQMLEFADLLQTKSGNTISCHYQAYDDWSGVPQTCFEDGLLFVCTTEASLTMVQNTDGKWVITDDQQKVLYEVFPYDNGPDYPSEGLISNCKNQYKVVPVSFCIVFRQVIYACRAKFPQSGMFST